ncbi:MAG: hypothetical protein ABEJ70_00425 [Halobacteriaceae archaeon]
MTDVSLSGTTLVLGPSNAGKTRLTATALETWVERNGATGVVVLEFGPELERDGRVLGGRLTRFTTVPDDAWHGVLDAHAPRAASADDAGALERAADNARRAATVLEAAPDRPRAVFVNDATIPFQHPAGDVAAMTDYCDRADVAVLNALESDELGRHDPVSRREQEVLGALRTWADRVRVLGD